MIKEFHDTNGKVIGCTETIQWVVPELTTNCEIKSHAMFVMLKDGRTMELFYVSKKDLEESYQRAEEEAYDDDGHTSYELFFDNTWGSFDLIDDELTEFKETHKNGLWYDEKAVYEYGEFDHTDLIDMTNKVLYICPNWNNLTNHFEL